MRGQRHDPDCSGTSQDHAVDEGLEGPGTQAPLVGVVVADEAERRLCKSWLIATHLAMASASQSVGALVTLCDAWAFAQRCIASNLPDASTGIGVLGFSLITFFSSFWMAGVACATESMELNPSAIIAFAVSTP